MPSFTYKIYINRYFRQIGGILKTDRKPVNKQLKINYAFLASKDV
ncbi:hypothetical protein M272_19745 [Vibrio natriegens NBRC 15636 = ATCC 14048 = DSM 759]|nr:hypothetical protein M272_19745 [Vibrio natriegens NBRC 15636 = ATCC 14048 = DSM 759]